jgi:hypothetical protein
MKPRFSLILALLALGIAARLAPYAMSHFGVSIDPGNTVYPWNFSPILPVCIFGGAFYGRRIMVYAIPYFRNTLISMAVFLPLLFSRVALRQPVAIRVHPFASHGA